MLGWHFNDSNVAQLLWQRTPCPAEASSTPFAHRRAQACWASRAPLGPSEHSRHNPNCQCTNVCYRRTLVRACAVRLSFSSSAALRTQCCGVSPASVNTTRFLGFQARTRLSAFQAPPLVAWIRFLCFLLSFLVRLCLCGLVALFTLCRCVSHSVQAWPQ